jgi:hypothetical protein
MANNNEIMRELQTRLGYYDASDIMACACHLVRKFGISGAKEILKPLKDMLTLLGDARMNLSKVLGVINQLEALGNDILSLDPIVRIVYDKLSRLNICPIVDRAIFDAVKEIDMFKDIAMGDFFADKGLLIGTYANIANNELNDIANLIGALSDTLLLVDGCTNENIPAGKTLADMIGS